MWFGVFGAEHAQRVHTSPHYYAMGDKTGASSLTLNQQIKQVQVVSKDLQCPNSPRFVQAILLPPLCSPRASFLLVLCGYSRVL